MPKKLYCWRCKTVLPMRDEDEYSRIAPLLSHSIMRIKEYRQKHGASIEEAQKKALQPALEEYFKLTGYKETNVDALYHHRISLLGPPCDNCGKPLRTPQAKQCAACGTNR